jgi:CDP-diacylglycerol---glycerol-3-phosphate 3-phosphatidyltransferase
MKKSSASTGERSEKDNSGMDDRRAILFHLRHQSWLAAVLLFSPWMLTLFSCWSIFAEPVTIPALLPGLAVAVYLQRYLSGHLETNHHHREKERLFPTLGAATWITLLRGGAIVLLAGFLPMTVQPGKGLQNTLTWAPGIIYLGISLADLLDGFVARRQGRETDLGKRLDIETDAAGLLVASLLAIVLDRLPVVYLLVGLAYYPFVLGIRLRQQWGLPVITLQPRPYSRIIAGFQMGFVGMVLLPIFNRAFISIAAIIFMTPLLTGFLRDWLVVSCRIKADIDQRSYLDIVVRSLMMKTLPWALRLAVLAGGIIVLAHYDSARINLPWQVIHSLCCLLAGFGFMGRSASLFLLLLLGSSQSPFGTSLPSMVVFGAAAALMLTGTGSLSLWAPEERVLYRRQRNKLPLVQENP